jgi:hypothetical protein
MCDEVHQGMGRDGGRIPGFYLLKLSDSASNRDTGAILTGRQRSSTQRTTCNARCERLYRKDYFRSSKSYKGGPYGLEQCREAEIGCG